MPVQIAVVGGGPAGLTAALLLSRLGIETAAIFPVEHDETERRTAALFAGSIELLRNLGVWAACETNSAIMRGIRIIDDRGALLRAPETLFTAAEQDLASFGYNVPNAVLSASLAAAAREAGHLTLVHASVESLRVTAKSVAARTSDGRDFNAGLVIGADGRRSLVREAAGIATRTWDYPQAAVVTQFVHSRPHQGISTEFHRPQGPLTTVPMPGQASSLVWVEARAEAARLAALPEAAFREALEARLCGLLGTVEEVAPRGVFPLSGLAAATLARDRVALVGEAAHVMPPIGAQGLNLGLRDVGVLVECLADAGPDLGAPDVLARYARARAPDVATRMTAIDALNRSLLTDFVPAHLARGMGLYALGLLGPLRRLVVSEGLQPMLATPAVMRPGGLNTLIERRMSRGNVRAGA